MPKAKGSASKKAQPECDLCGETVCSASQDLLQCEVCQLCMHRYCAGITRSHCHELRSKSTPFVCLVCTQRSQRAIIQLLQDEVTALRSEIDKLREASSLEKSATPEINRAALDALKEDVQQLESSVHGYSRRHAKPSYAKMAAANANSTETRPRKSKRTKQQVTGARRVWGTRRSTTVSVVKDAIVDLANIEANELQVKRKYRVIGEGRTRWWFVVHAEEETLQALDATWPQSVQSVQKHWKLEKCLMYVDQTTSEIPAAISDNETDDLLVQDVHHSSPDDNSCNLPNNTQVNIQSDSTTLHTLHGSQQKESASFLEECLQ